MILYKKLLIFERAQQRNGRRPHATETTDNTYFQKKPDVALKAANFLTIFRIFSHEFLNSELAFF